jgi:hypothetical protein
VNAKGVAVNALIGQVQRVRAARCVKNVVPVANAVVQHVMSARAPKRTLQQQRQRLMVLVKVAAVVGKSALPVMPANRLMPMS